MTEAREHWEPKVAIEVWLVDLDRVRPTEQVDARFVDTLVAGIGASGTWTRPLLVEQTTLAIMDGHHRYEAAKRLGLRSIPAVCVSYDNPHVHLESWRPGLEFSPEDILGRARTGDLLPYKSTRHITDFVLPQVRVPISTLRTVQTHGQPVAAAGQHPTRSVMLVPGYHRLCSRMRIRADAAADLEIETPETQAPHTQLRRNLQSNPAMAALLSVAPGRLVLGSSEDSPFFLKRTGLLRLPPSLLAVPEALSLATRWGLEASHLQSSGLLTPNLVRGVVLHGKSLLHYASAEAKDALLEGVPSRIVEELLDHESREPSDALIHWQMSRIESLCDLPTRHAQRDVEATELWNSVEELLISGGDSRLLIDRRTGFNKYGTTPRPRPEAVHFSSSTASSVTDYGFMYCDMLRRDLIAAMLREGLTPAQLRSRLVDAVAMELLDLLALSDQEADAALAPSGTDTELLAVSISLGADRRLTNILIAPDETGRGVREAGGGKYFDSLSANGRALQKGQSVWPTADIAVVEIAIRNNDGTPRASSQIAVEVRRETEAALARGNTVLIHMLASSKTGLSAPDENTIAEISKLAPDAIDVVVDACQMRNPFASIGEWVRRGWMVQVSGSKFLTGPPFSGALMIPAKFRDRVSKVDRLLSQAPAIGLKGDWSRWWRDRFDASPGEPMGSFGAIVRWLPALLEAQLFSAIPSDLMRLSFERFRTALKQRLSKSAWLVSIDELEEETGREQDLNLATSSIICFSVRVPHWDGQFRLLDEEECRRTFNLLNLDISGQLGQLSAVQRARARMQAHIGQPVRLRSKDAQGDLTVLRMVLGARFFSLVAHAGPGSVEAALESEIADAIRALEKLELIAEMWSKAKYIPA